MVIIYRSRYDQGPDMNPPSMPIMPDKITGAIWVISMPVNAKTHMITIVPAIPSFCN